MDVPNIAQPQNQKMTFAITRTVLFSISKSDIKEKSF